MAYQSHNLSALAYANGFTLWHYKTPDSAFGVDLPGYFNGAAEMLRVGDFIFVNTDINASVKSTVLIVLTNTGLVVATSNIERPTEAIVETVAKSAAGQL